MPESLTRQLHKGVLSMYIDMLTSSSFVSEHKYVNGHPICGVSLKIGAVLMVDMICMISKLTLKLKKLVESRGSRFKPGRRLVRAGLDCVWLDCAGLGASPHVGELSGTPGNEISAGRTEKVSVAAMS